MFHKLIKQKYLCQRVFCGNQSKTDGGGGGGQNPKHGERGKEQLNNKGCGSIIQSESHKVTKTFQVSF